MLGPQVDILSVVSFTEFGGVEMGGGWRAALFLILLVRDPLPWSLPCI